MDKIELRTAQRFLDNKGVPTEKPKPPAKSWVIHLGPFDFPDEEFDATFAIGPPKTWPYDTCAQREWLPSGFELHHWCVQTEDGRWLKLIDHEIS